MKAKTGGNFIVIAKNKNKGNLIKIICVLVGAVFAFTTSIVYGAFSWKRQHNSGYATGTFLPNQSYQIINDSLPNGIPFTDGVKEYEVALQYSYDYAFNFYVEYELVWSNGYDTSNVILNFSNRDAWIVDNSRIYYRDTVAAGTGKLPIIVGVDFVDCYDEDYFGANLKINIKNVKIAKQNETLDTSTTAGAAYSEYQTRKAASYSGSSAYVVVYNPTLNYDSSKQGRSYPKAPVGKTAFGTVGSEATLTKLFGNKNYVGLGAYVITGGSPINLVAKVYGSWLSDDGEEPPPSSAIVVTNTIKYNYADDWEGESYDTTTAVQEIRTFKYTIPAHTAVYVSIADSVEMVTRGMNKDADYTNYHIKTDLQLNSTTNVNFTKGIGTTTIETQQLSSYTTYTDLETKSYSVINSSKYNAALYNVTNTSGAQTYQTQVRVVNNTASKMSVSASYTLKAYISNGNSTPEYGQTYDFTDATHWARDEFVYTSSITVGSHNASQIIAPYSAMTICTSFEVPAGIVTALTTKKAAYANKDVWIELVPKITPATSTADDSQLVLETEISGTTAKLYAKNISSNAVSAINLTLNYSYFNDQTNLGTGTTYTTKPADWDKEYWKYYVKIDSKFVQVNEVNNPESLNPKVIKTSNIPVFSSTTTYYLLTGDGWKSPTPYTKTYEQQINPGEKVLLESLTILAGQTYNFSNYTLTGTVATASDVNLVNENTGSAYIKNNSTTKSYYIRFAGSVAFASSDATQNNFFKYEESGSSYWYLYGLIRPGQVIPINITASSSQIAVEAVEDTTGSLPSQISTWPTSVVEKLKTMYQTKTT